LPGSRKVGEKSLWMWFWKGDLFAL
jgi:hypothetical protein